MESPAGRMHIRARFRYSRPYSAEHPEIDGLPNYFHVTSTPGATLPLLEAGINPIGQVGAGDGKRIPAILIRSSPHKSGSAVTPWQDYFHPDAGYIHYFGDNKVAGADPSKAPGNAALLRAFQDHMSVDEESRRRATPLVFFRTVTHGGRVKGTVEFQGFGVISGVRVVTQHDPQSGRSFANYAFDFTVFDMSAEAEEFHWSWISARRSPGMTVAECAKLAPAKWKEWVRLGPVALDRCRRRVASLRTVPRNQQMPPEGSREYAVLRDIMSFYLTKRARFEALAAATAGAILQESGGRYRHGWITPASGDHGADFIGRLDLGTGMSTTKLVVLGQAKCEQLSAPTGGRDVARTVARLRRGWVGAYVTTSYFSEPVQAEVAEDEYPIVLVPGLRLAQEVLRASHDQGIRSIEDYLCKVDDTYEGLIKRARPDEILLWQ